MPKTEEIHRRRATRRTFLVALYERVDGSVSEFVNGYEIAASLGVDREETAKVIAYFEEKGFVRVDDHREGTLRLTAAGVDEAEVGE